jgi:hypothetical protein
MDGKLAGYAHRAARIKFAVLCFAEGAQAPSVFCIGDIVRSMCAAMQDWTCETNNVSILLEI